MKIRVTSPVPETYTGARSLPPGEYTADKARSRQLSDNNGRPCDGWWVYGEGRKKYAVMEYDYNRAVASGAIEEIKEAEMSNLPMVKGEGAVLPVSPQEQINQASDMARLLKEVVSKAGLARKLGGRKEHLEYEAWATIARWFHCTPSTEWTRPIKQDEKIIGWEARVNILDETGRVIGSSEGMCMSDEANWRNKPTYALRSMAQTRTAGKALRSLFAHIAVLAGYSPTPAEEMDGVEVRDEAPQQPPKPNPKAEPTVTYSMFIPSEIKINEGINEKTNKSWKQYIIYDNGTKYRTFDSKLADLAGEARNTGKGVRVEYKTGKYGNDITGLAIVV